MYEPIVGEKQCSKCRECKPLNLFAFDSSMRDGYRCDCKVCRSALGRKRYQAKKAAGTLLRVSLNPHNKAPWPVPTHTLADALSCLTMRKWDSSARPAQLAARL